MDPPKTGRINTMSQAEENPVKTLVTEEFAIKNRTL